MPIEDENETGIFQPEDDYDTSIKPKSKEFIITMAVPLTSDPDPLKMLGDTSVAFYSLIYKNLIDLNKSQQCIPSIATSWRISKDGLMWTVKISDDIYFHDGTLLTSGDVVFTIQKIKEYGKSSPYYYNISGIREIKSDGNTIYIYLNKPDFTLSWKLNIPIVSKKDFSAREGTGYLNGTGKFKAVSVNDKYIELEKNDDKSLKVRLQFVKSKKEVKSIMIPGNSVISVVSPDEGDMYSKRVDLYQTKYPGNVFEFISFNVQQPVLDKVNIRKAISCFIDVEKIIRQVYGGGMSYTHYPVKPDSVFNEWSIGDIYEYNPEKGKELMKRENAVLVNRGDKEDPLYYYHSRPVKLEILVNKFNNKKRQIGESVKKQLEQNGILVTLNYQSGEDMKRLIGNRNFDMLISSISLNEYPQPEILGKLYSNRYQDENLYNVLNINDDKRDELINNAYNARNISEFITGLNDIQLYLKENVPYIGLGYHVKSCVYSRDVTGVFKTHRLSLFSRINNKEFK